MIKNPVLLPGISIIGGAAGFLDPARAAGLLSGMITAKFWAEMAFRMKGKDWTNIDQKEINNLFKKTDIYKFIKKRYKTIKFSKFLAYRVLKTPKVINRFWSVIKNGKKRLG